MDAAPRREHDGVIKEATVGIPLNVTEWMKGYISVGAPDYNTGFMQGVDSGMHFMHEVLIQMPDVDRFIDEPEHEARMDGYIVCDALGGKREVVGGTFN